MDVERAQEKARKLMIKNRVRVSRESGYSYYHGIRVANIALTLRKYLFPEQSEFDDMIKVAGYFHDIAKGIEPHAKYGAVLAREALSDIGTKEELDFICEIIGNHCNKGGINDDHFTSKLIQDADGIDWIGANGVWIDLYHRANIDMSSVEYITSYKDAVEDSGENSIFNYDISKQIFIDRMKYKNEFIHRLSKEAIGEIYMPERFGL